MFGEGEHARQGIIGANWKSAFSAPLYISPESFLPLQAEARVAVFSCPTEGSRGNPARTAYRSYPVFCRACSRPRAKAGRIRCKELIDQNDVVAFNAEFELGVGDDNSLLLGHFTGAAIDRNSRVTYLFSLVLANFFDHLIRSDVDVVLAHGRLG